MYIQNYQFLPQQGQRAILRPFLKSVTQKPRNRYTTSYIQNYRFLPPFGGHRGCFTASMRSSRKFEVIFEIRDPKNLGFDIHQAMYRIIYFGLDLEATEAVLRPPRGQRAILRPFLKSMTPKT